MRSVAGPGSDSLELLRRCPVRCLHDTALQGLTNLPPLPPAPCEQWSVIIHSDFQADGDGYMHLNPAGCSSGVVWWIVTTLLGRTFHFSFR